MSERWRPTQAPRSLELDDPPGVLSFSSIVAKSVFACALSVPRIRLAHARWQQLTHQGGQHMETKGWFSAAVSISALAMALWALPAQAASIPGSTASLKVAAHTESMVEATHWRRRYAYYYGGYYPSYYY